MRIGDKVKIKETFPLRKFKNQPGAIEDIEVYKNHDDEYVANIKVRFDTPIEGSCGGILNWHWFGAQFVEDMD